jgi:(p)ppGpp synthase/HD superfamily hydrolase
VRPSGASPGGSLDDAAGVLADAYRHVKVKTGKGAHHARQVARILAEAGCDERVQVAGLLHDIVEDTPRTVEDIRDQFGPAVAALVAAVTEDDSIDKYRERKQALREQVVRGGPDAIDIALADKVATLDYVLSSGAKLPKRKRTHYEAVAALGAPSAHSALAVHVSALLARVDIRDRPSALAPDL